MTKTTISAITIRCVDAPIDPPLRNSLNVIPRAPLVIAVVSKAADHPKIPVWEQQLSAGAVCMNLLSASAALGFGACWLTEWMAYDEAARAAIGLEASELIAGFIHIGQASETPADRPRPDLEQIASHWQA
jgi:nitroreductase